MPRLQHDAAAKKNLCSGMMRVGGGIKGGKPGKVITENLGDFLS